MGGDPGQGQAADVDWHDELTDALTSVGPALALQASGREAQITRTAARIAGALGLN